MKNPTYILGVFLLLFTAAHVSYAGQITIVAEDVKGREIKNVRFSVLATGAISAPTTADGRTKVALPAELQPGDGAELRVGRIIDTQEEWVFISPWDGWVNVPKAGGYCKVALARRGDREALESGDSVRAMTKSIVAAWNKKESTQQPLTEVQRKVIFEEEAMRFGLPPGEIDKILNP